MMTTMQRTRRTAVSLAAVAMMGVAVASGASVQITNPTSSSAYHAGDPVPVQWDYEGTGDKFSIHLLKAGKEVADLCEAEEGGVCFDLTQDQTVLLPRTGLESGSDYTMRVKDESSSAQHTSPAFTVIGDPDTNVEVTSPDGRTSLSQGGEISVSWLYVGANQLFDIYVRQGGRRVSENLCAGEVGGSCKATSPLASATVKMPVELVDSGDYRLLVVDKADDDAWGMSAQLPVGVEPASTSGSGSGASTKLGLVIGLCAGGVCLLAVLLACLRKRNRDDRRTKLAAVHSLNKRRPPPSVSLNVEGMAQPDGQEQPPKGVLSWLSGMVPRKSTTSKVAGSDDLWDSDKVTPTDYARRADNYC